MIRGIGIDLCSVAEMQRRLQDPASTFAITYFTARELHAIRTRPSEMPAQHAAARYAAKEACLKAFAQAVHGAPQLAHPDYREMEVLAEQEQPPRLVLHGALQQFAREMGIQQVVVSLSHEADMATAVVVIE